MYCSYNKSIKFIICLLYILLLASFVIGQQNANKGNLFGNVVYAPDKEGDYGTLQSGIVVQIQSKTRLINITSNEAGLLDNKLNTGKYTLLSARTAEGVFLKFVANQYKSFEIKKGKTTRFDIVVLKPKS